MATHEALAFDLYGTLVDPIRIWTRLERDIPDLALRIAEVWRQKQLEYTFRLTAMERYEDFEQVTRRALDYALAVNGRDLDPDRKAALLAQYDDLEPFADVEPGLRRLHEAGYQMVIFSNGSPRMIASIIERAGLHAYLEDFVSVDEVRAYKPSPRVYHHLAARLDRPLDKVRLISSNPFDVLGGAAVGMPVAWINRSKGVFDTLGDPPELQVATLVELADALQAGRQT